MAQGAPVGLKRRHISMPLTARLTPCPCESHFGELRSLDSRGRLGRRPVFELWVRYVRLPATPVFCRQAYQLESEIWSKLAGVSFRQREKATSCRFPTSERRLKVRRSSRVPTTSAEVLREVKT